jgi:hypothetical protein
MSDKLTHETLAKDARDCLIRSECYMSWDLVTDNLYRLRLFLDTVEGFIEKEEHREVEALKPYATDGDFWAENYPYQWQDIIGSQLRQTFIVALMSATEFHLSHLCGDTATIVRSPISHDDLKGSLFACAQKFLSAFGTFSAPSARTWELIGDLYKLLNAIVHNAAMVDSHKAGRLEALVERAPGIAMSSGFLEIKREFCLYTYDLVESFFRELHEQQVALCRRASQFAV